MLTSRAGGSSPAPYDSFNLGDHVGDDLEHVAANRLRLAEQVGLTDRVVYLRQVHGTRVVEVDAVPDEPPEADALVTRTPGLGLAVLAADCVPVLLVEQAAGVVAVAHAGRKGMADGVVPAVVADMVRLGARAPEIDVLLGPAICGRCYQVPAALADEVADRIPESRSTGAQGSPALDLHRGLRAQLAGLGVGRIVSDPRCTREDPALFSYRREPTTGRQAGLVWIST